MPAGSERDMRETGWWGAALIPLLIVLSALMLGGWTWGLMDDLGYRAVAGGWGERFLSFVGMNWVNGRAMPVWAAHAATFYASFRDAPLAAYLFRFVEVAAILGVWGWAAALASGRRGAFPIFIAAAAGFVRFYDSFFYLSLAEPLGLLFTGAAIVAVLTAFGPVLAGGRALRLPAAAAGVAFVAAAALCKETFLVVPVALGAAFLVMAGLRRQRLLLWWGLGLLVAALTAGFLARIFLMRGYSAQYTATPAVMLANVGVWGRTVVWQHAPWLVVMFGVWLLRLRGGLSPVALFAMLFSGIAYLVYLLGILPWSGGGHYAIPLGIFFSFPVAVIVAEALEQGPRWFWGMGLAAAVLGAGLTASAAVRDHYGYQRDTRALVDWMADNALFVHDLAAGAVVRCNAAEPSDTIPALANFLRGTAYGSFVATPVVREILADPATRYYVWGRTWGDQDLRRLKGLWMPVFWSERWAVFRRMY